jgi:hypothetical protein
MDSMPPASIEVGRLCGLRVAVIARA